MNKSLKLLMARGVCLIALGVVLIVYSDNVAEWLVRVCGVLFVLPGLFSTLAYYMRSRSKRGSMFTPVLGIGSILFGSILIAFPTEFVTMLMYILAALLLISSLNSLHAFYDLQRSSLKVSFINYLFPLLQFGAGLYLLFQPLQAARIPFVILGAGFILGGLLEFWSAWLYGKLRRRFKRELEEVVVPEVENLSSSNNDYPDGEDEQ